MFASVLAFALLLSVISNNHALANKTLSANSEKSSTISASSNIVTNGLAAASKELSQKLNSAEGSMLGSLHSLAYAGSHLGKTLSSGATFIGHNVSTGANFVGTGILTGVTYAGYTTGRTVANVAQIPMTVIGSIGNTPIVSAVIRPADHIPVPVIGATWVAPYEMPAQPPVATATQTAPAQPTPQATQPDAAPQWPLHGRITTLFGASDWPYQPVHTGIDISDGHATPIKPFKPGRVLETIHSYSGLGNHVVVDHGGGLTSVYGHLSAISVQVGQVVDKSTPLGLEGTTGASTGTHLHFEIRVSGRPENPMNFISGQP
jgi:hypothetical protein